MSGFLLYTGSKRVDINNETYVPSFKVLNPIPPRAFHSENEQLHLHYYFNQVSNDLHDTFYENEKIIGTAVAFNWAAYKGSNRRITRSDLKEMFNRFQRGDLGFVSSLTGFYAIIFCDFIENRALISSDWGGNYPTYFGKSADRTFVGSNAARIADMVASPINGYSYVALQKNLAILPEQTLFADVKSLPLVNFIYLNKGEFSLKLYDNIEPLETKKVPYSLPDLLTRFNETVVPTVISSIQEGLNKVDITGGHDSRLTLGIILANQHNLPSQATIRFKTVGPDTHPDVVISKELMSLNSFPHDIEKSEQTFDFNYDFFNDVMSILGGTTFPDRYLLNSFNRESARSLDNRGHLIGSWGVEFLRDEQFRKEIILRFFGKKMNTYNLVKFRFRPIQSQICSVLSEGRVSDEQFFQRYVDQYDSIIKQFKPATFDQFCDTFMVIKGTHFRKTNWTFSHLRETSWPYLTSSILGFSYSVGMRWRLLANMLSEYFQTVDRRMCSIKTDRGFAFYPLRPRYYHSHAHYLYKDLSRSALNRPLITGNKAQKTVESRNSFPEQCWDIIRNSKLHELPFDPNSNELSNTQTKTFLALLMVESLCNRFPGIQRRVVF